MTAETCKKAGSELGDLVVLLLDDISNKEQISQFVLEAFEAIQALGAVGIPKENKAAVATNIVEGLLTKLNSTVFVFPR